ncbi:hypothetical protein ACF0H5_017725 [Mactra antiquata]
MELSIIKRPKLVVALDIGSTYSGYAWEYIDEFEAKREPHFNTNWGAGALQAGLGKRNVLLALGPEAAAISCIHLTKQRKKDMNNFGDVGNKFLVADLGGGTADLSETEVQKDGTLKELCQPHGDNAGGQNINNAFFGYVTIALKEINGMTY